MSDEKLRLLLEKYVTGGPASVMVNRNVKRSETTKIQYYVIEKLYGQTMSQFLPTGRFLELDCELRRHARNIYQHKI